MAPGPEVPPAVPARSGVRLQRDTGADIEDVSTDLVQVPARWLEEAQHSGQADRVDAAADRLRADYELVTGLAFEQFAGPGYDYFQTELAKYGLAVMAGWMRRGLIFARCRDRGYGGLPELPLGAFDDDDVVQGLADETVAKALKHFARTS